MKESSSEKANRLDKFISCNSSFSRSDVRKLIKAKRIEINSKFACNSAQPVNISIDQVFIDGEHIKPIGLVYLMLHKPIGYVSATKDSEHPTVIDLVRQYAKQQTKAPFKSVLLCDLQIVGRLDIDTTGLVLLTNDGDWNHKITSPHSFCKKTYFVTLAEQINTTTQAQFVQGIQLEGEKKKTQPARIELVTPTKAHVTITEGKYHQIKRMFGATGNRVIALHRERIGAIKLCGQLKEGEFRFLTTQEIESVRPIDHLVEIHPA